MFDLTDRENNEEQAGSIVSLRLMWRGHAMVFSIRQGQTNLLHSVLAAGPALQRAPAGRWRRQVVSRVSPVVCGRA